MKTLRIRVLFILVPLLGGCISHKHLTNGDMNDYGNIELLSPDHAQPVVVAPHATKTGEIEKEDWATIVKMISRLPDSLVSSRVIQHVECFGDPAIAVQIQLHNHFVYLVKTAPSTWKVVRTYFVMP